MDGHFARMLAPEPASAAKKVGPSKQAAPSGSPYYIPSRKFQGAKQGYVFTKGAKGVGYYLDGARAPADEAAEAAGRKRKRGAATGAAAAEGGEDGGGGGAALPADPHAADHLDEAAIAKLLEAADERGIAALDEAGLRQMLLGLERKVARNQKLRMKFPDEPSKFMESEVELDAELRGLQALSAAPELYPALVALDGVPRVLGLLAHENTDVSLSAIALLAELVDPEAAAEAGADGGEGEGGGAAALAEALAENQGLELLLQNLARLDEASEEDAQGVFNTLQILENLIEIQPSICIPLCEKTNILEFLLNRVKARKFDNNKLYASELLSILLQADPEIPKRLGELQDPDGVEGLLQAVAPYRRRGAAHAEEAEAVENIFDSLMAALLHPPHRAAFREAEGYELLLRCVREGRGAAPAALRALEVALGPEGGAPEEAAARWGAGAARFVGAGGLKLAFPVFMGRGYPPAKAKAAKGQRKPPKPVPLKRSRAERAADVAAAAAVVARLCLALEPHHPGDAQQRLLGKFVEAGLEKSERCAELALAALGRLRAHDAAEADPALRHQDSDSEDEEEVRAARRTLRRLDAGLAHLQQLGTILAFISAHSKEARDRAAAKFKQQGRSLGEVAEAVRGYAVDLGAKDPATEAEVEAERSKLLGWVEYL